jgi:hypothetical protein
MDAGRSWWVRIRLLRFVSSCRLIEVCRTKFWYNFEDRALRAALYILQLRQLNLLIFLSYLILMKSFARGVWKMGMSLYMMYMLSLMLDCNKMTACFYMLNLTSYQFDKTKLRSLFIFDSAHNDIHHADMTLRWSH